MQCPAALTDKFGCGNATDWCDSGKYTCGLQELAARRPCVIISLGSSNEWDFERDIFMRTNCRILVFDCMCDHCVVPASIRARTSLYPVCLGENNVGLVGAAPPQGSATATKLVRTWPSLLAEFVGHDAPTYLKMDIEGAEVAALQTIVAGPTHSAPHLIGFELHQRALLRPTDRHITPIGSASLAAIGHQLRTHGYELLSREDNRLCPLCTEILVGRVHQDMRKDDAGQHSLMAKALPTSSQRFSGNAVLSGHTYPSNDFAASNASKFAPAPLCAHSLEAPTASGNRELEHRAFLNRCGPWCDTYIALHKGIVQGKTPPRYLEIDCATSLCGGWGNILQVVGAWTFLAYLTDRAAVVRLPPSIEVHRWATSPFFHSTVPPHPGRYGQNSTYLLASYSQERNAALHFKPGFGPMLTQHLARADLHALLTQIPIVTARPDTTIITPSLLQNPWARAKMRRDHFPDWLGAGVGMENMVGRSKRNDSIVDLFAYMHFHPTCGLWEIMAPYLQELGFPHHTYDACHMRSGDKMMVNTSRAAHVLYQPLNFTCLGEAVGPKPFFFAADTREMVESARRRFPSQVVTTDGVPTHLMNHHVPSHHDAVQLDPSFGTHTYKTFADFYLLAFSGLPVIRNSHRSSFSQQAGGWGRMRAAVLQNRSQWMPDRLATPATRCCALRCWAL